MLFGWLAPPWVLPIRKRETLMIWLDALGKWSLIDAFVLIMMMVSFNLNLNLWEEDVVIVRIFVEANWGFYGFLLATMVSIILSHIILGCHRYAEEPFHVSTHA